MRMAPTATRTDEARNDHDWGWIGLIGLAGLAGLAGRRKREEMRAPRARRDEDPLGCTIDNSESRFPSGSLVNTSQIPYQA